MVESATRRTRFGLTLVEVMVALGLIAVSLMLILGLVPAGIRSSQRASDIQSAAAWSRQLIEETPPPETFPITGDLAESHHSQKIGPTDFTAVRRVSVAGNYLYTIEVETSWNNGVEPLRLSLTRFNPAGPEALAP